VPALFTVLAGLMSLTLPLCSVQVSSAASSPAGVRDTSAEREEFFLPPISGIQDEATYYLYVNEQILVTQHFAWREDGTYTGEYTLSMAGQSVKSSLAIDVDSTGVWTKMKMDTPQGPADIVREGNVAKITSRKEASTVCLKPGTILFENFSPALMSLAVRSYDQEEGGKQTFPVFIIPSVVMDASLERIDSVERAVSGQDVKLTRYTYGLPGVNVTLYVDEKGRVVFGDVPAQHAAYVRRGYESMLRQEASDSLLSRPEYEIVIDKNAQVPMRDGVYLATDIYRPAVDGRFPVILVRTPYKKEMNEIQANFFARRGYVYAVQDCRGRFSSQGVWEPFMNEAADGYDSVEWLAAQMWSTGKIGMIGGSYLGWVQWWAARDRPPHLATIIPNVSPPDPYFNIPYEYGVFFLTGAIWWADVLESRATADISGNTMREIGDKKYTVLLKHLPVIDVDKKVLGKENPYWRRWIEHPDNDSYWEPANFLNHLEGLDIPVFHQSGWFDGDGIGTKLNYLKMHSYGHRYQKLVLGPWGHTDTATRRIRDRDFGEAAIVDLQREYLRWLDRWLKGIENGIDKEPLVRLFVMGSDKWLTGDVYPLPETRETRLFLSSGGHANTSKGDGKLVKEPPAAGTPTDRFSYDPDDPTPSPYYYVKPEEAGEKGDTTEGGKPGAYSVEEEMARGKAYYGKVDEERQDILVYETDPLDEPLTFVGPVSAVLYAASSAKDTDWFMRLSEIESSGEAFPLVEGKIRARYRASFSKPELLKPGKVYEYNLDLWHTGITIPAGNKLRVEVASASFPVFSRNLNTGGHNETEIKVKVATQTIYHDAERPSHVVLPVIADLK
jgi:putative CocE/NonD family hydrolase